MSLHRIIYLSKRNPDMSVQELKDIFLVSDDKNLHQQLTGMLIYSNSCFMQVLEGELLPLNRVYSKISQDKRHYDLCILEFCGIQSRSFGDWNMKIIAAEDYQFPESIVAAATQSPYNPFPLQKELAIELLLRVKHQIKTP
jgi:hypothetical protein